MRVCVFNSVQHHEKGEKEKKVRIDIEGARYRCR